MLGSQNAKCNTDLEHPSFDAPSSFLALASAMFGNSLSPVMPSTIIIGLATLIGLFILKNVLQLWRNIAEAKASGIPYIVLPVFQVNRLYQLAGIVLTPVLRALPSSWTDPWLDLTLDWEWKRRYEPFARVGADTFLAVSPGKITLNTAEASVIDQMTSRRHDFPKALEVYEMLQIFGNNVITVEGQDWRRHRKITSPPFSEANNVVVWKETLSQTEAMINGWFPSDKERSKTLRKLAVDAMRLTLHIISKAGFGKTLTWPAQAPKGRLSACSCPHVCTICRQWCLINKQPMCW